jgi:hypothetical protein
MKRNIPSIMRRGLKASRRGAEGPGVYLATTLDHALSWARFVHSDDVEDLAFIRIRKDELEQMFGLYPNGEIQWDGADGDVIVGDADTVIPPELLEVVPISKDRFNAGSKSAAGPGDPEIHVPGYGIVNLSWAKNRVLEYIKMMDRYAKANQYENVSYFAYGNGVLKAMLEAIMKTEKELESSAVTTGSEKSREWQDGRGLHHETFRSRRRAQAR